MEALTRTPDLPVTVDLEQQTIVCGNKTYNFTIDPVRRMRLLNGWDDIALTGSYRDRIAAFKAADQTQAAVGSACCRRMSKAMKVLIAGAGPVGLTAALLLGSKDIPVTLLGGAGRDLAKSFAPRPSIRRRST